MTFTKFSKIRPVPQAKDLVDICLSKTNRQTPTVIHKHFEITRIRNFYIRKVKHCANEFTTRFDNILRDFPVLTDIHPFYSEQMAILYDRDTYKITLSKLNKMKVQINKIMSNSIKMIKFGDSMYRCKCLKTAGLGQMASYVLKLKEELSYLENVRQDFNRLPEIDITKRIVLTVGFPNVGKSTFVSQITKAKTEVNSFAFTTKSLYVGHYLYKDLTYQFIDTPGILDKELSERNRIEMLTVSAMAHLNATILYFIDVSMVTYTIQEQIALFENVSALLQSNFIIVISKTDAMNIGEEDKNVLNEFIKDKKYVEISYVEESNDKTKLIDAANFICQNVLESRVELKREKVLELSHRIKFTETAEKNEEYAYTTENGEVKKDHIGVNPFYLNPSENDTYFCKEKYDKIPEIMNGKNISDYMHCNNITQQYNELLEAFDNDLINDKVYDILTPEEQELYERINRARIAANMRGIFRKRGFNVKGHEIEEGLVGNEMFIKPNKGTVVRNKKTQQVEGNKDVDKNPKHLFRGLSAKHAKTR